MRSNASVYAACSHCGSTVVRRDVNLELLGKIGDLVQDMSPLQVSSTGTYQGQSFTCVGRTVMSWEQGNWNEWYVVFNSGKDGWLAEAQGNYMMTFQEGHPWASELPKNWAPGTKVPFGSFGMFQVSDIKDAVCSGSEGELPFIGQKGRRGRYIDFIGANDTFGTVEQTSDGIKLFIGSSVDFNACNFSGLRHIDGW